MKKNKKIAIIGGFGWHNWGDDAQLYNNLRILKEKGYKNITVMSPNDYIGKKYGVSTFPSFHNVFLLDDRKNDKKLLDIATRLYYVSLDYPNRQNLLNQQEKEAFQFLKNIHVLFVSGSGTINTRSLYGLLIMLVPCIISKNLNKIVIMSGQGVLPFEHRLFEAGISYVLNRCDKIYTRDFNLGYNALKRINVDLSKIEKGIDDAFTTPRNSKCSLEIPENTIAINVSHFIKTDMCDTLYKVAFKLKAEGYYPIFNYFQDDKKEAERCSLRDFPIYSFEHPEDLAYFYSKVIASIGMRYHSAIFGIAGEKPTINIYITDYQKYKIKAIQEETKIPNFGIDYKNLTVDNLYNQLKEAIKNQPPFLKIINKNWRKKGNLAIKYLEEIK